MMNFIPERDENGNPIIRTQVDCSPPFAAPLYRTKNDASSMISVSVNSNASADHQITEERYVSGGEINIENPEFGDYITAEVYDKDSVIPEAYRAALCENWPSVAKYVIKDWVPMVGTVWNSNLYVEHKLDTRPLNAKITAGLYLRVTYYAVNSGSTRRVAVNYSLTKKL